MKRDLVFDLLTDLWKKESAASQYDSSEENKSSSTSQRKSRNSIVDAISSTPTKKIVQLCLISLFIAGMFWLVVRIGFSKKPITKPFLNSPRLHEHKLFHKTAYEIVKKELDSIVKLPQDSVLKPQETIQSAFES